jgi:LPS-assembly protein
VTRLLAGAAALACLGPLAFPAASAAETGKSLLGLMQAPTDPDAKLLVEADSVAYDMDADIVTANGKVVIYYGAYVLVADTVSVNRTTKKVNAHGNVEITDPKGSVVRGDSFDLTDDLREGVAEAFEMVTTDRVAFQARHVTRTGGDETTLDDATYLPCIDCNGVKGRKPIWQIRANRIIHKQGEQTVVMENAKFEFLGVPLAWVPMLSQPDPSVKQKTGFLLPKASYDKNLGFSVVVPYHIALSPSYDLTLSPAVYTRQGMLFDAKWRQRLDSGEYTFQFAGIRQSNPELLTGDADRRWRGGIISTGDFKINDRWHWGWNVAAGTDARFMKDYDISSDGDGLSSSTNDVAVNDLFLSGVNGRNRFDAHAYGFYVEQQDSTSATALPQDVELQSKQPIVHPVIDYTFFAPKPVLGGELSVNTNLTSLSRTRSDLFQYDAGGVTTTRLRGAAGTFDRASIDALWRRRFVDGIGETFTPFLYFKGDAIYSDPTSGSGLSTNSEDAFARAMPAAGLEYSFPVAVDAKFGHQIIEPVAQLIVRPDEHEANVVNNDDSQSLVFDAHSLFDYDKFSGYDRQEGGTRANVGLRYSGTFAGGYGVTGQFGQSFQLAGTNSFAMATAYDTGLYSGLENDVSDYVASLNVTTSLGLMAGTNLRLDPDTFAANRVDAQVVGISGPLTAAVTYAFIRAQPDLGIDDNRSEIQTAASLRLSENWRLFGSLRYDLVNKDFVRDAIGVGYDVEEFSLSLSYANDMTVTPHDQTIYLRAGLKSLGALNGSFGVSGGN